jgi:tRNA (cytidine56-2'-O)-methyltransferase
VAFLIGWIRRGKDRKRVGSTISVLVIGKGGYECNLDLCSSARAFGASSVTFASQKMPKLIRYFATMNRTWGGNFTVSFTDDWKDFINSKKNYKTVYLTKYGIPINKVRYSLKTYKNILLIVTHDNTSKSLLKSTDFNVSITTQPHCSTAAITVFLHLFYEGRELAMHFENAKYRVVPEANRLHVEKARR